MDDPQAAPQGDTAVPAVPFLQRMYDRPFLLLGLGLTVMLVLFTFWGLWEIVRLPTAPLP